MKKTTQIITAVAIAALVSPAFAADDAKPKLTIGKRDRFTQMDADKDGKVTLEEYKAAMAKSKKEPKPTAEQIEAGFKRLDKDKSGDLSKEEANAVSAKKPDAAKPDAATPKPSAN